MIILRALCHIMPNSYTEAPVVERSYPFHSVDYNVGVLVVVTGCFCLISLGDLQAVAFLCDFTVDGAYEEDDVDPEELSFNR